MVAGPSHLSPGEKGQIVARTSTGMKEDLLAETIEVVSNDPVRPKATLILQATIFK